MATTTQDAMYQQIGGEAGLTKVVDTFYERLWADPDLKHYFDNIDRMDLKKHQRMFLTHVLGAEPAGYGGRSLSEAHTNLGITHDAFDKVAWHLRMTLEEEDVERTLIPIIMGFVEGVRGQVVEHKGF